MLACGLLSLDTGSSEVVNISKPKELSDFERSYIISSHISGKSIHAITVEL